MKRLLSLAAAVACGPVAMAGPFAPPAGGEGSTAVAADDARFVEWAQSVEIVRGPVEITEPDGEVASYGSSADAVGPADATGWYPDPEVPEDPTPWQVVSLGDGGTATARFARPVADGPGPDFAVFENSFNDTFLELAFVEVSSDGVHFARFPATSLTPVGTQIFGGIDATDIHNLAGKYRAGFGTPFDLAEIHDPRVNTAAVTHVRIVDVVGSIDPALATRDADGRIVNDPFTTPYESGGFDLDAVGVLHAAPGSWAEWSQFYFETADADPAADPDRDGLPNRLEWALWTSPLVPGPAMSIRRNPSGAPMLVFRHDVGLRPGSLAVVTGCADLASWAKLAEADAAGWHAIAPGVETDLVEGAPDFIAISVPAAHRQFFQFNAAP